MTNLKKTLAVVLAFAMVLGMSAISTLAYTDVAEGTVVSEAVGILSNLKILTGFEDGTFKPDETVTRAQMAAIICRTLGYEDQAQSSMGSTVFNDVAADHWASGYINVAQAQQIINGYGDGNYGPEDLVTYEQAVKMIVSALGYDLAAQGKGGYPTGYLAIASAEGITKNANGRVGDAAKRGTIAVLVYNSLEVRLMDQNSWSTDGTDTYGKQDANILSRYLDVVKYEGYVTSTPVTKAATAGIYDPTASKEVTISEAQYWDFVLTGVGTTSLYQKFNVTGGTVIADCSLIDGIDAFLGKKIVAYVGTDEVLGDTTLFAITEAKGQNSSVVITGDQLIDSDHTAYNTAGQVSYKNAGSNRVIDASLQLATGTTNTDVDVYVNYVKQGANTAIKTSDFAGVGKLELISNDYDSDIEVILVTSYDYESVIEEVAVEEGVYAFECYTGGIDEIDPEDEDVLAIVYVDGAIADVTALQAGYTVSTVEIAGNDFVVHYASSKTVTGAVDSYSTADGVVEIAGEEYEVSPMSLISISSLADQEGTFFLNVDGKIAHNETETIGNANYGVAILVGQDSSMSKPYIISIAHMDGSVVDYELKDNAAFVGATGIDTAAEVAEYVADILNDGVANNDTLTVNTASTFNAKATTVANAVFKVTTKNGQITKIANLDNAGASYTTNRVYDADAMSYGSAQFDDSTIVINIKKGAADTTQIKAEHISVGKVSTFFADGDSYTFNTLDVEKDIAPLVIGYNLTPSVPADSAAIIVTALRTVSYDDDDAVQVTGVQAGEEVSFILYNDTKVLPTLAKGDIILAAAVDADGVSNDCEILYTKASGLTNAAIAGDNADGIFNAFGTLNAADTTNAKFFIDANVANSTAAGTDTLWGTADDTKEVLYYAAEGIPVKAGANYTLVDYSEDVKNPEVSKKNPGTSLFSKSDKYKSFVFVRVYDEKLVEVIVLRYAATKLAAPTALTATTAGAAATVAAGTTAAYSVNGAAWTTTAPVSLLVGDVVEAKAIKTDVPASNLYYNDSDIVSVTVEA